MSSKKVQAIQDWLVPQKVKDIQSFLGSCNFYQHFIPSYSNITNLLLALLDLTNEISQKPWIPLSTL
jgi:hypothetical protein